MKFASNRPLFKGNNNFYWDHPVEVFLFWGTYNLVGDANGKKKS